MKRNKQDESVGACGAITPILVTFATVASASALSNPDFELIALRQIAKFYDFCFTGKSFSAVTAIRDQSFVGISPVGSRSPAAPGAKMAPFAMLACNSLPLIKTTPATAIGSRTSSRLMSLPPDLQNCCTAATASTAARRAEQVQAFQAERTAAAAAAAGRTCYDSQPARSSPGPLENTGFGNSAHHSAPPSTSR